MKTPEEVLAHISRAWNKKEIDGFIYFADFQPYEELLYRARPDGTELLKISRDLCKSFEVNGDIVTVVEEYSRGDGSGYGYDRYSDTVTYQINGEEVVGLNRSIGNVSSSD